MPIAEAARPLARERRLYAFNLGFLDMLLADVSDEELEAQPLPDVNTPRWILGHLAIVSDDLLKMLGAEPACPPDWDAAFTGGTAVNAPGAPTPSKAELVAALREGERRLGAALDAATPESLAGPNPATVEIGRRNFPTLADMAAFLLTTHFAVHLGQLSAWRRMTGRPALF